MGGSQHLQASSALRTQLIPWVEKSTLSDADRQSIIERLNELVADMDANRLTTRQLSRLNFRLSGAPIFQWGVIEEIQRQANVSADFSVAEKEALNAECDRLLRTARDGKIAMEQIEFATQQAAVKEQRSGRLTARQEISAAEFQEFLRRITAINDRVQTEKKPLVKSVSQVFRMQIEDALNESTPEDETSQEVTSNGTGLKQ